jgi:hypothetical protein
MALHCRLRLVSGRTLGGEHNKKRSQAEWPATSS